MKTNSKLTLLLLGFLLLAVALACRSVAPGSSNRSDRPLTKPQNGDTNGSASAIAVTLDDFDVSLEPGKAVAGEVTFTVNNEGALPHDFRVRGNGLDERTPMIDPGESETLTMQLEPGTYDYECTVEGHAMLGMQGSFTVEASQSG